MFNRVLLFLVVFFGLFSSVSADYTPSVAETINMRVAVSSSYDYTYTYTGSVVYLDFMTCSFSDRSASGSLYKVNLYESGSIKGHIHAIDAGTYTIDLKTVFFNSFRLTSSQVGTSWATSAGCHIYGWYMSPEKYQWIVDLQTNTGAYYTAPVSSSSGSSSEFVSIDNSLRFQNDFLILVLWFFLFVLGGFASFHFYSFLKRHYFFNKKPSWKS